MLKEMAKHFKEFLARFTITVVTLFTIFYFTGNLTAYCSRGLINNNLFCVARLNLP